jgi:hypothetical protein
VARGNADLVETAECSGVVRRLHRLGSTTCTWGTVQTPTARSPGWLATRRLRYGRLNVRIVSVGRKSPMSGMRGASSIALLGGAAACGARYGGAGKSLRPGSGVQPARFVEARPSAVIGFDLLLRPVRN